MIIFKECFRAISLLLTVVMLGLLTGCLDKAKTNTDAVTYKAESRPLGVIAGADREYAPGAPITLSGRLVGDVTTETILWEQIQIEGEAVQGISDWSKPSISFIAPQVEGIKALKFQISARNASGGIINGADGKPLVDQVTLVIVDPKARVLVEVEDSNFVMLNGVELVSSGANFIGGAIGSHTVDLTPGTSATFTLPSGSKVGDKTLNSGFYFLYVEYAIPPAYGDKMGQVTVNGVASDTDFKALGAWQSYKVGTIKLNEGTNTIEVGGGWSYYRIDSITLIPAPAPAKPLAIAPTLVNSNASAATKDLMAFLVSSYGSKTLSGQTEFMNYGDTAQTGLRDFNKVVDVTGGDAPAIVAFDFMDYSSSRVACGAKPGTLSTDMIAAHKQKNVILAPIWHWNAPTKLKDSGCSGSGDTPWYSGFYTTASTFDLKAALADTNSADYKALINDIDSISLELKKFADADIPLLWRPLHEAQGAWFWWGKSGPEELKTLWKLMYERMTTVHGLNNLIWVYTYAGSADAAWYPGDAYVDIVGFDGYDHKNANNPFKGQFTTLKDRHDGKKLVALTETGTIPNVELMQKENAWWAFFITWNSGGEYGPQNADPAITKTSYAFSGTLNLDDVPGGRAKVAAGLFDGLETSISGWEFQVNWTTTTGIQPATDWTKSGQFSLAGITQLKAGDDNIILQTYPAGGVLLGNVKTLKISAHADNAGTATQAMLFAKDKAGNWKDGGAVSLLNGSADLTLDISTWGELSGFGVRFMGAANNTSESKYYLDDVIFE